MIHTPLTEEILEQINQLGPEQQRQVLDFARALTIAKPRGVPGRTLLRFAGTIAAEDLQSMAKAIEEDCERINSNEW